MKVGDNDMKVGDNDMKVGDNDMKVGDNDMKVGDNSIKRADNNRTKGDNHMKSGDTHTIENTKIKRGNNGPKIRDNYNPTTVDDTDDESMYTILEKRDVESLANNLAHRVGYPRMESKDFITNKTFISRSDNIRRKKNPELEVEEFESGDLDDEELEEDELYREERFIGHCGMNGGNNCNVIDFKDTLFTRMLTAQFEELATRRNKPTVCLKDLLERLPPENFYVLEWLVTRQIITCANCKAFARLIHIKPDVLQMILAQSDYVFPDSF